MDILVKSYKNVQDNSSFTIIAWVVLADHFHILLDPVNNDPSKLLQKLKMSFAAYYRKRMNMQSGRVWQNRFWDHIIRDQDDLNRHIDYIQRGVYTDEWGIVEPQNLYGEYGE